MMLNFTFQVSFTKPVIIFYGFMERFDCWAMMAVHSSVTEVRGELLAIFNKIRWEIVQKTKLSIKFQWSPP